MDKELKLKLQFFATTPIPGVAKRTDSNNYVEGQISYGQVIDLTLQENSWLFPGRTCTKAVLSNNGTIVVPTLDNAVGGGVTELCEDGEAGTYGTGQTTVSINKKVSEKFDGCFTVANIADMLLESAINTKKLRVMSETFNNWAYGEILKVATPSTITKTDGDEIGYVFDRIAEYKVLNHMQPAYALVSTTFLNKIYKSLSKRETNLGDETLINGYAGVYNGVTFIERYDQAEDLMLGSSEDLLIATPSKPEQIPDQRILGAYNASGENGGFELGMVSLWDVQASKGIVETWVHKYFGLGVLNQKSFTIDAKGGA